MKKILISVLIVLLAILAYFAIFQGISIGTIEILNIDQIIEKNDELTNKISEINSMQKKDYPSKKTMLSQEVTNLLEKKEEYFNIAKVSTDGEIQKANTEETYLLEYLWVRVGRHARFKGVNIEMVFTSSDTAEQNMQNLGFTVTGQYVGIIEFIYAIEDDSELGFKIEDFKVVPNEKNLTATFNVRNVRVKAEKVSTTIEEPTKEEEKTDTNTSENTTTES